jgi:hypothetical protein
MRLAALVTAMSLGTGGCALTMEAVAHHNSGGTACLESPLFGGIDLLIAGVVAAATIETDASYGWFAVSGVFGASGLAGIVSAYRCRGGEPKESDAPPAHNTAPSFGDAPVDPEARPATHEEMFGTDTPPPKQDAPLFKNGIPTGISPPPPPKPKDPDPQPPSSNEPKKLTCKLDPRIDCPDGYYCALVAENTGECMPIK